MVVVSNVQATLASVLLFKVFKETTMSVQEGKKIEQDKLNPKFEFNVIPETTVSPFLELFDYSEGLVRSEPGGFVGPPEFGRHIDEFIHFQTREDDVWVVTFPKCGSNIKSFMVLKITCAVNHNNCLFYWHLKEQLGPKKWCGC